MEKLSLNKKQAKYFVYSILVVGTILAFIWQINVQNGFKNYFIIAIIITLPLTYLAGELIIRLLAKKGIIKNKV